MRKRYLIRLLLFLCVCGLGACQWPTGWSEAKLENSLRSLLEKVDLSEDELAKKFLAERRRGLEGEALTAFDHALVVSVAKEYESSGQMSRVLSEKGDEELLAYAQETTEIQALGGRVAICKSLTIDLEKLAMMQESYFVENGVYSDSVAQLGERGDFTGGKWNVFVVKPYRVGRYQAYIVTASNSRCLDSADQPASRTWDSGRGGLKL